MSPAVGILSASILFCLLLAPPVHAQASGTVSIVQLPAWNSAPSGAKLCLWDPGQYDVASTLGCPSPTLNVCYCPTGDASSSVLNAITGCMTYWYSIEGILQLPTAVSVYSQYCAGAGAGWHNHNHSSMWTDVPVDIRTQLPLRHQLRRRLRRRRQRRRRRRRRRRHRLRRLLRRRLQLAQMA